MSSVFGSGNSASEASSAPAASGIPIQSSVYGACLPMVFGGNRCAPNLIWYGDFHSVAAQAPATQGSKGSIFGGGGTNNQQGSYSYFTSFAMALCEGPIHSVGTVWTDKSVSTMEALLLTLFEGAYDQTAWTYLSSHHPESAFGFHGIAYVAATAYALGSSAQLPHHTFEVFGFHAYSVSLTIPDADPSLVVTTLLTDPKCGLTNFPFLGTLTDFQNYSLAANLLISPIYENQRTMGSMIDDIMLATNSEALWSNGEFKVIPRGDSEITGNGKTYEPPPVRYDLTDDDFLPSSGSSGSNSSGDSPVLVTRKRPSDIMNSIKLECKDRAKDYNKTIVEAKDLNSIDTLGLFQGPVVDGNIFCNPACAQISIQLQLQRQAIANTYSFATDLRYLLLEPMDIVTLTHQELDRVPVRIKNMTRTGNVLNFIAEDYPAGVGTAAQNSFATGQGFAADYNSSPGNADDPMFFEPTDQLAGGLFVGLLTSGGANWGGCDVWVSSTEHGDYQRVGRISSKSRYGTLTAPLATVDQSLVGPTLDPTNVLSVHISQGQLLTATQTDALAYNTLCYVDGEYISYADAELTGSLAYNLSYLYRGVYGTDPSLHAAGSKFARLDNSVFYFEYNQNRIGGTVYVKLLSFNIYGVAMQSLADVGAYTYSITGLALSSPLPDIENVRTVFEAGFTKIWWDEVQDFRNGIRYIVRKGDTFYGGQDLGSLAHPPFIAFGPGTYWIMPTCQPLPDLLVFGETPSSITIQGNMLTANVVQTTDFQAISWPGTFTNVGKEGVDPTALLRLVGSGDILTDTDILNNPNILNSGSIAMSGEYITSLADILDVGYVADCYVNVTWKTAGIPITANILADNDILNNPDVLNAGSGAFINVWIEIRTATESLNDLFDPSDMFSAPDMFAGSIQWSDWQRFVPGVYRAQYVHYRAVFETLDNTVVAYLTEFVAQVSIPARIDHYIGNTVGTGGLSITFEPDDASSAKPFNGGPLVGGVGNHPLPAVSMTWPGNPAINFVIDSLTLSQVTFHFENAATTHILVTGVDVYVEGY